MKQERIIKNRQMGSIKVDPSKVITFPEGILGFEDIREYVIIDFEDHEPFQWLVALDDPEVQFPIISPILVKENYSPSLARETVSQIGDFSDEDLLLYAIVTIRPGAAKVTADLKGPIIINQKTRLGKQIVLDSDEYPLDHPVI